MKVRISGKTESKLAFVKAIKTATDWGLKESKEFCDRLYFEPTKPYIELDMTVEKYKEFCQEMKDRGLKIDGIAETRRNKLMRILSEDFTNNVSCCSECFCCHKLQNASLHICRHPYWKAHSVKELTFDVNEFIDNECPLKYGSLKIILNKDDISEYEFNRDNTSIY